MILVREITQWEDGMDCNHTYIMSESMEKMFGYFKKNKSKEFLKGKHTFLYIFIRI